ncbi:copper resistance CopC family protein [Rhodoluna limnophila]|uniref:copper resistance CopC family protein n=1 Tax=Rhodoluna limnophila TaxID=232537 RepID=UPI001106F446|nr:copper resistance CopC family protein [Rhodoluna limnophila]
MNRLLKFIAALALTVVTIFGTQLVANAHTDELVTYPEADSIVDGGYIPIEMTFAEPLMIMEDGSGHEIAVTDPNGDVVKLQCAIRTGVDSMTTTIASNEEGQHTVAWRSVSEDGHPVSGSFAFQVRAVPDFEVPANTNLMCPEGEPTDVDDPSVISQADDAEVDGLAGFLTVLAIALPLVAILGIIVVLIRRKKA